MSEHEVGAHEIDQMPNGRLFYLLFGLSLITLLACVGVVQLFNAQVRAIISERGRSNDGREKYEAEMESVLNGSGTYEFQVGKDTRKVGYIPVAQAKAQVLADPTNRFKASPKYNGWDRETAVKEFERPVTPLHAQGVPNAVPMPAGFARGMKRKPVEEDEAIPTKPDEGDVEDAAAAREGEEVPVAAPEKVPAAAPGKTPVAPSDIKKALADGKEPPAHGEGNE